MPFLTARPRVTLNQNRAKALQILQSNENVGLYSQTIDENPLDVLQEENNNKEHTFMASTSNSSSDHEDGADKVTEGTFGKPQDKLSFIDGVKQEEIEQ